MKTYYLSYLVTISFLLPATLYAVSPEGWTVTNFNNENGLPQNSVKYVEMDNEGFLWMATESGIVRYDGQHFRVYDNNNSALKSNRYLKLGKDNDGHIYCISDYNEISYYNTQTGFSKPVPMRNLVPGTSHELIDLDRLQLGMLAAYIPSSARDANEFTWHPAGKQKGFLELTHNIIGYVTNARVRWVDSLDANRRIYRPFSTIDGQLCYINENREMVLIDSNGIRSHKKTPVAIPWSKLLKQSKSVLLFKQQDQLLLNAGGDIYEVMLAGNELKFRLLVQTKDIPLIVCVRYFPQQGLLVIGSATKGLFIYKKQQLATISSTQGHTKSFYALAPYGNNQILTSSGILPNFRPVPEMNEVLGRLSILFDHNRHYWYSTGAELVETNDQFHALKKVPLASKRINCVQEDEEGTVWLTQGARDFGRIVADTFQLYHLDGLEGKYNLSFLPAGNQTFWLVGHGICMWVDVKHGRQRIYHEFDNIELRTLYFDKQGNLWLGSYGKGYFLFMDGRFTKMPEDEAHSLKAVHCFQEDRYGFMWMTTNNGLFQCATEDLYRYARDSTQQVYHQYYGIESGLLASEFNGGCTPSGLVLGNGRFAFPSMEGIVLFHPDSIQAVLPNSKLFIEQVLLDGVVVNEHDLSSIAPSFKRLELTVSSPYFGNPRNLSIQYNIDGLDDRWYSLSDNKRIVLNQLKHGSYTLRLRKQAGFGAGNYITTELPLYVMPFFYQTWWFQLVTGIVFVLLVLLIIRIRYKYLVQQRDRLEAEVKDRTGALVYHNKLLEKLTLMIAHDLKSPLHFLSKVTGNLRNKVEQENLPELVLTTHDIKNTADQVSQFVDAFSLWASSFSEGFTITKTSFVLEKLLQELSLFFKEMLAANGNELLFIDTPADYILDTDRELLKVILRNIIDNANKHNRGCVISVSVHAATKQYIYITIADTGQGMREPVLKRIQDRIAQVSTAESIERNSRMGFQMIIDFAMRLDAELEIQSEPGKGTAVTLCIQGKVVEASPLAQQVESAG
jgi:signal transduction histidine kinase/ligand-binding sensor domain-containing protein